MKTDEKNVTPPQVENQFLPATTASEADLIISDFQQFVLIETTTVGIVPGSRLRLPPFQTHRTIWINNNSESNADADLVFARNGTIVLRVPYQKEALSFVLHSGVDATEACNNAMSFNISAYVHVAICAPWNVKVCADEVYLESFTAGYSVTWGYAIRSEIP